MSKSGRIIEHFKRSIVGYLALFLVLSGGTAYAANTVFSADIVDGEVKSVDLANNGVTGTDVAEATLSVRDIGCQGGLVQGFARVKGLAGIGQVYTSDPGAIDIARNCAGGTGTVQVRRASTGLYFVRFEGNSTQLALAVSNSDGRGTQSALNDDIVSVAKINSGPDAGAFRVEIEDVGDHSSGSDPEDGQFTIVLV